MVVVSFGLSGYKQQTGMENGKQEKVYELIDVDGLSTCLAEDDWKDQTKNVHLDDLYSTNAVLGTDGKSVEIVKEVRGRWSTLFFALKEGYLSLFYQFTKHTADEHQAGETEGRPEGTGQ